MKQTLECNKCLNDLSRPVVLGTKEYDCTDLAEVDWSESDEILEGQARRVLVEYWTGEYWGDGQHILSHRYWLNMNDILKPTGFSRLDRTREMFKCECGDFVGRHIALWYGDYFCPIPKATHWVNYIQHGKKRKLDKKTRLKIHKKKYDPT